MSEGWRQAKPVGPVDDDHLTDEWLREARFFMGLAVLLVAMISLSAVAVLILLAVEL